MSGAGNADCVAFSRLCSVMSMGAAFVVESATRSLQLGLSLRQMMCYFAKLGLVMVTFCTATHGAPTSLFVDILRPPGDLQEYCQLLFRLVCLRPCRRCSNQQHQQLKLVGGSWRLQLAVSRFGG